MDHKVLVIFLLIGFCIPSSHFYRLYHYVNLIMNWTDARDYCREQYHDLATFESMDDMNRLNRPSLDTTWSWIGLLDDPKSWQKTMGNDVNSWRWSVTGETGQTSYHNWTPGAPNYYGARQECVIMMSDGTWDDVKCTIKMEFVCYTDANPEQKLYIFIPNSLSWTAAQTYCREHHTDLAMIENAQESNEVWSVKSSGGVWIGLYRKPWKWADSSPSIFRHWTGDQPNNYGTAQHCMSENSLHVWDDDRCSSTYTFICQEVPEVRAIVRMKIQTDADMTDPAINTQILYQLNAALKKQSWTDSKLYWKIQPKKQEEEND